jgi:hypothetical protein
MTEIRSQDSTRMLFMNAGDPEMGRDLGTHIGGSARVLSNVRRLPLRPNLSRSGALLTSTEGSFWIQAEFLQQWLQSLSWARGF